MNTDDMTSDEAARWAAANAATADYRLTQAAEACRANGHGPDALPHLTCTGVGCDDCRGGALKCGFCMRATAVVLVDDGEGGIPGCRPCADEVARDATAAETQRRAETWGELQRAWLEAGAAIRAERARGEAA